MWFKTTENTLNSCLKKKKFVQLDYIPMNPKLKSPRKKQPVNLLPRQMSSLEVCEKTK